MRNLDYIRECALRVYDEDPFIMKTSRSLDRDILESVGLVPDHILPAGPLPPPEDEKNPQLRPVGRNETNRVSHSKRRVLRLAWAAIGGLSLVIPMLIIANVPGKIASLIRTCISMLIFVLLIAFFRELSPNEVLATTAAYAAALVVFVGTSLNGSGRISQ